MERLAKSYLQLLNLQCVLLDRRYDVLPENSIPLPNEVSSVEMMRFAVELVGGRVREPQHQIRPGGAAAIQLGVLDDVHVARHARLIVYN